MIVWKHKLMIFYYMLQYIWVQELQGNQICQRFWKMTSLPYQVIASVARICFKYKYNFKEMKTMSKYVQFKRKSVYSTVFLVFLRTDNLTDEFHCSVKLSTLRNGKELFLKRFLLLSGWHDNQLYTVLCLLWFNDRIPAKGMPPSSFAISVFWNEC